MKDNRRRRGGFTLLEILVVVMIITILATLVGINVADKPGIARVAAARTQMGILRNALQLYRMEQGRFPTQEQGLGALCERPQTAPVPEKYPAEGYLESRNLPTDPWKRDYVYLTPGRDGAPYEIITYGADGDIGGEGEAADLNSLDL